MYLLDILYIYLFVDLFLSTRMQSCWGQTFALFTVVFTAAFNVCEWINNVWMNEQRTPEKEWPSHRYPDMGEASKIWHYREDGNKL